MPFPVECGMSHNYSRFESYGHVKFENPHESSRSPKGQSSQSGCKEEII